MNRHGKLTKMPPYAKQEVDNFWLKVNDQIEKITGGQGLDFYNTSHGRAMTS